MLLHCPPDIAEMFSSAALLDRAVQTFLRHANQSQALFVDFTDRNRRRGIADKPFERGAAVNREDVAFLQNVIGWKAVHHLVVDRSANRIWKPVVSLERRQSAGVADHLLRRAIDLDRGDTGFD